MSLDDNTNKIAAILAAANTLPDRSEGVVLDATLTQSGKAADAKAVGDALAGKQPKGNYLTQDNLQSATNAALAQAKASGEFDGADGTPGKDGADGKTPNITIGNVETLEAGESATASITGESPDLTLNLGIPKGADGEGKAVDISTTLSSSSTDSEVPSAKCVYDLLGNVTALIDAM